MSGGVSEQRSRVASWTTVDMTLQYRFSRRAGSLLPAATLSLSAINVFDREPPYVANEHGFLFDGVNAEPRGRFLSVQLGARW